MYHLLLYLLTAGLFLSVSFFSYTQAQQTKEAEQIDTLLKEKGQRTAVERKISSQLLYAIKAYKNGKDVNQLSASLRADKDGNLMVDINAVVTDDLLDSIKTLGGKIIYPSKQFHSIRAQVPVTLIEKIAAQEAVKFIKPAAMPITSTS